MDRRIRVLVVDDSALVRQTLSEILSSDPEIEVVGTASDPFAAAARMKQVAPDVLTLDIEMPRMSGLEFLEKLMKQHPIPVVVCSSVAESGSAVMFEALSRGAVEVIEKPKLGTRKFFEESRVRICDAVKAAAKAKLKPRTELRHVVEERHTADAVLAAPGAKVAPTTATERVIVIGASTGGTEALLEVLSHMPASSPGIVVVQHMPEHFTATFADRLNGHCAMEVREARDRDAVVSGLVLIAPGNRHMLLKRAGTVYSVEVRDGPLVARQRPSVDVLFRSAARYAGPNAVGVILTGMGDDGARGMAEMKQAGAATIAQDEATCVVFGMPNEAIKRGAVDRVLPLGRIADVLVQLSREPRVTASPVST